MRSWCKRILAATGALTFLTSSFPVWACGPFFDETIFVYTTHPDVPLRKYAGGTLGLLHPDYARSYLVVAYRYLEERPFAPPEQNALVKMWEDRLSYDGSQYDVIDKWKEARKKAGVPDADLRIDEFRGCGKRAEWGGYEDNFLNCPNDAFTTATATLNNLVQKYGTGSAPVKEWVKAQDMVFSHCSGPQYDYTTKMYSDEPPLPTALTSGDPASLADRAYQVACANFYACNYDEAHKLFMAIAADKSSRWQPYAAYLAARAILRNATVGSAPDRARLLQESATALKTIANDAGVLASVKNASLNLVAYIEAQLDPVGRLATISDTVAAAKDEAHVARDIGDLTTVYDKVYGVDFENTQSVLPSKKNVSAALQQSDLIDWINNYQGARDSSARLEALKQWNKTHSNAWLIAYLAHARSQDLTPALSKAAQELGPTSPAFWTVRYHLMRLAIAANDKARAEKALPDLTQAPPSTVNAFRSLNLSLVQNVEQFLANGIQHAAGLSDETTGTDFPDDLAKAEKANDFEPGKEWLIPEAADVINEKMPLSLETKIATEDKLPPRIKADLLQAAFVKAVITNNFPTADRLNAPLQAALPKLSSHLADFQKAKTADEKRFVAAAMILMNPGLQPDVSFGTGRPESLYEMDDFQNNWWCPAATKSEPDANAVRSGGPKTIKISDFVAAAEKQTAARENQTVKSYGVGVNYLLKTVLAWASKNPQDARLPETLYHAIRSPKFSCTDKSTRSLSKNAFDFMHAHYPKNQWTVKSKYYYG